MKPVRSGGGWPAIRYGLSIANRVGWRRLFRALNSKNACKTCALGMGGQKGGMRNEAGHWPEVCKKSLQAMAADMQDGLKPEFFERLSLDRLAGLSPRELEAAGRIVQPLYAGPDDTHYRVIDWDEALRRTAEGLTRSNPDETFFYFSGRSSNEAGFLLQLFARLYGTNNVNNCSYYCHQASGVGLTGSLGSGTATLVLDDVEQADLFFLIGGNPASNHPRLMRSLMHVRRRGGKVIVVNPVVETGLVNFSVPSDPRSLLFGSEIASQYVQPHIGGDIALLTGVAKRIFELGAVDHRFVDQATEDFDSYRELVEATSWEEIERGSGVARNEIERIATTYLAAKNVVFAWTMGITHHEHGVQNVQTIVNLALLRGMVGRPNAGLLPIRGHSNVQGIGSMGVTPTLKQRVFDRLQSRFGVRLPTTPGFDTMACMRAASEGAMRFGWSLGGNLYGSNPDSRFAAQALGAVDTMVYMNTTLNTGHVHGRGKETIILPVLARDEDPQTSTQESMFNFVRLSDGGKARHAGPRGEVAVIADVAARVLNGAAPIDWDSMREHSSIRQAIAEIIPGYEKIAAIDDTKQEFQIAGRTFHAPRFATESGKARFHAHPIPPLPGADGQLTLMTIRSEGQFNTVVYEETDLYRNQDRRDVILLSREDIDRLGLAIDCRVTVRSSVGAMPGILVREYAIKPGAAAMYFPEANLLVPTAVDPASKTPCFKSIPITLRLEPDPTLQPAAALPDGWSADQPTKPRIHDKSPENRTQSH